MLQAELGDINSRGISKYVTGTYCVTVGFLKKQHQEPRLFLTYIPEEVTQQSH
jgi:hypothetical protein